MAFPVDLLVDTSHDYLERSAEEYMSDLRYGDPENPEYFCLPNGRKVPVSLSAVGFVPLYGTDLTHKVMTLYTPEDKFTAVAFYLADQWWAIEDILKTSDSSRKGLLEVKSLGERVVLYILNRIIYRDQEMSRDEIPFLCHGAAEYAKILWQDGEAIGFYSVKPEGSVCNTFITQRYKLPVLDTLFVRKGHRGKNHGLQILEDFVDSFTDDALGLKYPLTSSMYRVCSQYLEKYPEDRDLLWEVEGVGHWFQRANITDKLQAQAQKLEGAAAQEDEAAAVREEELPECSTVSETITEHNTDVENEHNESEMQLAAESQSENDDLDDIIPRTPEDQNVAPVSTRTRSRQSKQSKLEISIEESVLESADNALESSSVDLRSRSELLQDSSEDAEENRREEEEAAGNAAEHAVETPAGLEEEAETEAQERQELAVEDQDDQEEDESVSKPGVESINGDITDETTPTSGTIGEDLTSELSSGVSNTHSEKMDEEPVAVSVPVIVVPEEHSKDDTLEKDTNLVEDGTPETAAPNQEDIPPTEEEKSEDVHLPPEKEEETETAADGIVQSNAEPAGNIQSNAEQPDDALVTSGQEAAVPENSHVSEEVSTNMSTVVKDVAQETEELESQSSIALGQGSLVLVELEDVSFQEETEEQKTSAEPPQEPAETLSQSAQTLKAVESSSEETEVEAPVVDRRSLRKRTKAQRGPSKKKSKLST
ncbi:soluble lamin-associated protein of 75 kDa [Latimeria chalumnae]|uniref:soluble lamin-associated protein of 75 kDa n=1 Tax=Latimeria chalumnae TaxID=7897 RepID=UPI0003C12A0C|nr:PREDICTED: soluble lamin-associated protein of 75 kDa [Latimeria chalumnae]|eukprot:XP_006009376.1 PREDICTED: soluble lamin-associated protein of 75 kDa [Latimeria chalumnae]